MIKQITTLETFAVRHPELRAGKAIETCYLEGDNLESTKHFGYFINEKLVGVATLFNENSELFRDNEAYRLRGMAVLKEYQKEGFGKMLIDYCEKISLENKGNLIWFNARIAAVGFYEKLGYKIIGDSFEIGDIGQHYVMFKKLID